MRININVKRKFKVNGKEYNSIEEMPLTFNGQEYNSIDEMPQNIRQLYEEVLIRAAETGDVPPDMVTADDFNGMLAGSKNFGTTSMEDMGGPVKVEPTFSKRTLIVSVLAIALIILLYYVFQVQGR